MTTAPPKLRKPVFHPCPGAVEQHAKPGDFDMCQDATTEFLCEKHWNRVSPATRRAFNAERERERELGIKMPSPLMKQLIEKAIVESAIRLKPTDPPPIVELAPHAFYPDIEADQLPPVACRECGRIEDDPVHHV